MEPKITQGDEQAIRKQIQIMIQHNKNKAATVSQQSGSGKLADNNQDDGANKEKKKFS